MLLGNLAPVAKWQQIVDSDSVIVYSKMEDTRIAWMKDRVYASLNLRDDTLFENLLARDEQKAKTELLSILDNSTENYSPTVIFYPLNHEVEELVEVVEGIANVG